MWKEFVIAFCLGGVVVGGIVNRGIDRTMNAEYVMLNQVRVAHLARTMVDTCFFDRIDPDRLQAQLEPAGFRAARANSTNAAHFFGPLVDRLSFEEASGVAECSALVQTGRRPTFIETCRTAIEFNRSLNTMLAQDVQEDPYATYELVHQAGLTNAKTNQERCHFRHHAHAFTWTLRRGSADFDVTLDRVISDNPLVPGAPAYKFSIQRVAL